MRSLGITVKNERFKKHLSWISSPPPGWEPHNRRARSKDKRIRLVPGVQGLKPSMSRGKFQDWWFFCTRDLMGVSVVVNWFISKAGNEGVGNKECWYGWVQLAGLFLWAALAWPGYFYSFWCSAAENSRFQLWGFLLLSWSLLRGPAFIWVPCWMPNKALSTCSAPGLGPYSVFRRCSLGGEKFGSKLSMEKRIGSSAGINFGGTLPDLWQPAGQLRKSIRRQLQAAALLRIWQ